MVGGSVSKLSIWNSGPLYCKFTPSFPLSPSHLSHTHTHTHTHTQIYTSTPSPRTTTTTTTTTMYTCPNQIKRDRKRHLDPEDAEDDEEGTADEHDVADGLQRGDEGLHYQL